MRIETKNELVPIWNILYDDMGEIANVEQTGTQEITITELYADTGMIIVQGDKVLSDHVTLGADDNINEFSEIRLT